MASKPRSRCLCLHHNHSGKSTVSAEPKATFKKFDAGGGGDCFFLSVLASMRAQNRTDRGLSAHSLRERCARLLLEHPDAFASCLLSANGSRSKLRERIEGEFARRLIDWLMCAEECQKFMSVEALTKVRQTLLGGNWNLSQLLGLLQSQGVSTHKHDQIWQRLGLSDCELEKELNRRCTRGEADWDRESIAQAASYIRTPGFWTGHEAGDLVQQLVATDLRIMLVIHQPGQQPIEIVPALKRFAEARVDIWRSGCHYQALKPV